MAFRKPARRGPVKGASTGKDAAKPPVEHEAPVSWSDLLQAVVEKPGIVSESYRRFHNYSMGNGLLVMWQCLGRGLEVGPVAAYGRWQELGRQVRKGEKALLINMPRPAKFWETDKETGEKKQRQFMRFIYKPAVFVYAQTDPIEGKEDKSDQLSRLPEDWSVERAMSALDVTFGPFNDTNGNCLGFFNPETRTLALNPMGDHPERTLLHELAHSILHPEGYAASPRAVCELEAEATAMLVAYSLGLGGADESRGYCQSWMKRGNVTEITDTVARRIFKTAQTILEAGQPVKARQEEQEAA